MCPPMYTIAVSASPIATGASDPAFTDNPITDRNKNVPTNSVSSFGHMRGQVTRRTRRRRGVKARQLPKPGFNQNSNAVKSSEVLIDAFGRTPDAVHGVVD